MELPRLVKFPGALIFGLIWVLSAVNLAFADPLTQPTAEVLLKITGKISNTNIGNEAHFDLEMLQKLGATQIKTKAPWIKGTAVFEGVLLSDLLDVVGAKSSDFKATALDKYKFDFAGLDYKAYPVIVAWSKNGEKLNVRTLGPLKIMMPFSDYPEIDNDAYHNAAVFQLIEISVY